MPTLTLLIADDHELFRTGTAQLLASKGDFQILGEAENGADALRLAQERHPDVVLMDIDMPVMNGIQATQAIKTQFPEMLVIMLSSIQSQNEVLSALASGANAYCNKDISTERLIQVIEMVKEGALWIDPSIAQLILAMFPKQPTVSQLPSMEPETTTAASQELGLTQRELDVLACLVQGLSNTEIASQLSISTHTVKTHICKLLEKLSVTDRTQAAIKALQNGIVPHHQLP